MTNAALYYYFPNKEALFSEVLSHHVESICQRMREAAREGDDCQARLKKMLMAYCENVADNRAPLFLLRLKSVKSDQADELAIQPRYGDHIKAMLSPFEEELRGAFDAGILQSLPKEISPASLLLGLFHGLIQHRRAHQDWAITEKDVSLVVDIFWKGLADETKL